MYQERALHFSDRNQIQQTFDFDPNGSANSVDLNSQYPSPNGIFTPDKRQTLGICNMYGSKMSNPSAVATGENVYSELVQVRSYKE